MIGDLEAAVKAAMAVHCRKPIPGTRSLHCTLLAGHDGPCPRAKTLAYWGDPCPQCQAPVDLLSTQNEWCFYCKKCDMRFNANREAKPA